MGTLSSELGPCAARLSGRPRIYADANVPAGLVRFMRQRLRWDVLFVLEHDDLRRARDGEHYRRAREMCRTLVSLDHDYFDDRRFPPEESGGVIVLEAPDERMLAKVLVRLDRVLFGSANGHEPHEDPSGLPLWGRKLLADVEWPGNRAIG